MTRVAIALNDAGIVATRSGMSERVCFEPSPGYALLDARGLRTGRAAIGRSRWTPRGVCTTFWDALDDEPLPRPYPGDLSRADLAHVHLLELWQALGAVDEPDGVLLVTPGWYSDEQLALVAGIARACGIPVDGVTDLALAACAGRGSESLASRLVHADVHLHRVAIARLRSGSELRVEDTVSTDRGGLVALRDLWARLCAEIFVRETRFDPLHAAETEQRLYDEVERAVRELGLGDAPAATLSIEGRGKTHSIEMTRDELAEAAAPIYGSIVDSILASLAGGGDLLLSERLASLPGLDAKLERALPSSTVLERLPETAPAAGVLEHQRHIASSRADGELVFVTGLPRSPTRGEALANGSEPRASDDAPKRTPTHVLHDGVAHALTSGAFALGPIRIARVEGRVLAESEGARAAYLNDRPLLSLAYVFVGDRLRAAEPGCEVELIEVPP